jgi:integrase
MPRRAIEPGSHSPIDAQPYRLVDGRLTRAVSRQSATVWRARSRYRALDGSYKDVSLQRETKPAAIAAVEAALADLQGAQVGGMLAPSTRFIDAGLVWLDELERGPKAPATKDRYQRTWKIYVNAPGSHMRPLTLAQANDVQRLTMFLQDVADRGGNETARQAKSVVSLILGMAVRRGVLPYNAARSVGTIYAKKPKASPRDTERAFTAEEEAAVLAIADARASYAVEHLIRKSALKWEAVADALHFLAGTGVRRDEARNLQWADVNLSTKVVLIRGTKTETSHRRLTLPTWLAERLRDRAGRHGTKGYVFRAEGEKFDQSNFSNALASVIKGNPEAEDVMKRGAGCDWATPHCFRRTVATKLDRAGIPIVAIADQLGHEDPAMTTRKYLGRDRMGPKDAQAAVL